MRRRRMSSVWSVVLFGVGLVSSFAGAPARANLITYATSATFTAGTDATVSGGGSVITVTDPGNPSRFVTITYTPTTATVDTPVVGNLGSFTVNASAVTGSRLDIPLAPVASTFDLTIHQLAPTAGMGTFNSKIDGAVSFNSGFVEIRFSNTHFNIGTTSFTLVNLTTNLPPFPNNTLLLDPTATGGKTQVKAFITGGAPVPEPSSIALAISGAIGMLGLGARHGRRKSRGVI